MEAMSLAPSAAAPGPGSILGRVLRPAIGFNRPADVLKDPDLSVQDRREILSSWASDGCAVPDRPHVRWMPGSLEPVPIDEVLEALWRLDRTASTQH